MASPADTLRSTNQDITALVERDLTAFWGSLNLSRPEAARDALLEYLPTLTTQYGDVAATVAGDWYDDLRASAGARGTFAALLADPVPDDLVTAQVRFGAQHLFTDTPNGTLEFLLGVASKYVLQPGRDTIATSAARDPAASGWHRQARANGCDFCRMLQGRGAVYKRATADFAAHSHCHCIALPSWDASAPEVPSRLYVASQRTSKMTPEQRDAHRARVRMYLADFAH